MAEHSLYIEEREEGYHSCRSCSRLSAILCTYNKRESGSRRQLDGIISFPPPFPLV